MKAECKKCKFFVIEEHDGFDQPGSVCTYIESFCYRNPKRIQKDEDSWCGEFVSKTTLLDWELEEE